jgi:pyridoxine kinase
MNILSIQSWVAYGHVGNASAVFPLQRLGAEVWAVNTVQFSNHTGYGAWRGHINTGEQVRDIVQGIADRGVFPQCDAVLSGYMGDAGIGTAIIDAANQVRAANQAAIWCCDPVLGDDVEGSGDGFYVRPGIPEFMRDQAVPAADIITPNRFELEYLTGTECRTLAATKRAVAALHARGPRCILVTSLRTESTPADALDMLVSEAGRFHLLRAPLLPLRINGAGDAISALFLFHYLASRDPAAALANAGSAIHGLLRRTAEAGSREILTIAAQDEFVNPSQRFTPQPC